MEVYESDTLVAERLARYGPYEMPFAHHHPRYEFYFLQELEGKATIDIDGQTFNMTEGSLVIIDANLSHRTHYLESKYSKRILFEISPALFKPGYADFIDTPVSLFFKQYTGVYPLDEPTAQQVGEILNTVYSETILKEKNYEKIVLLRVFEIILLLTRSFDENYSSNELSSKQIQLLEPIMQHIMEHLHEDITLESLAEQFFLDKSYLSRIFKLYTGKTVVSFINQKRIEQAQRLLLLQKDESMQTIAESCGFKNQSYFTKVFKEQSGMTPRKFRQSYFSLH